MRPSLFLIMMAASPMVVAHHLADNDGEQHPPPSRQQTGAAPAMPRNAAASPKGEPAPTHTYCFQNVAGKVHCTVLPGGPH